MAVAEALVSWTPNRSANLGCCRRDCPRKYTDCGYMLLTYMMPRQDFLYLLAANLEFKTAKRFIFRLVIARKRTARDED
jgi:hypothetical protein